MGLEGLIETKKHHPDIAMRSLQRLVTGLTILLAVGCASTPEGPDGPEGPATSVRVENQSFADLTIYVFERGRRIRLGNVTGLSSRTFEIPERLIFGISSLRFQADPVGSNRGSMSQEIPVSQGDALRLVIPPF